MIPRGVEIFVGLQPIDLRWGFDRLAGIVKSRIDRDVRSRAVFVLFGKRRHSIKVLFFDGTGLCVLYKRLDSGVFLLPKPFHEGDETVVINDRALDDLLSGIDVEEPACKQRRPVLFH